MPFATSLIDFHYPKASRISSVLSQKFTEVLRIWLIAYGIWLGHANHRYKPYAINQLLHAKRQALDYYRHEALSFHQLTHIDEVQFG
jgi:hypothetical protein